jgi:hypothetical protein
MREDSVYISVGALLEKLVFNERDALLLPFYLNNILASELEVYLDFTNMKTNGNSIQLLYDKISYMYGYETTNLVHVINSDVDEVVIIPYYNQQDITLN